jgi:mono/diheme cytochrome c family protein
MGSTNRSQYRASSAGRFWTVLGGLAALITVAASDCEAGFFTSWGCRQGCGAKNPACGGDIELTGEPGGTWYWLRGPDEEKRVTIGLYNRYCIRCHGVDGRGVWDIPDVPDFTNARWQASRSDGQLARITLEGRGACMPPFRGTLTLEESWAMARYLRTFVPGTETPRPDTGPAEKPATLPTPQKQVQPPK